MITAHSVRRSVGVAPGTTTFTLSGARAPCDPPNGPGRDAYEEDLLNPPGKITPYSTGPIKRILQKLYNPYGNEASLKGARTKQTGRRAGLGLVLAPGTPPSPYEIVYVGQDTRCYQGQYDRQYQTRGEPGFYFDSPLGAIPTDAELSRYYGYTPVMSTWTPFKQPSGKTLFWSNPWIPPNGYWTNPQAAPPASLEGSRRRRGRGLFGLGADPDPNVEIGPILPKEEAERVALQLKEHNQRMFVISMLSASAVVATAAVNIIRGVTESKRKKKLDGLGRARSRRRKRK
jgi:hypothetical protein